jgi:hypothetical protein
VEGTMSATHLRQSSRLPYLFLASLLASPLFAACGSSPDDSQVGQSEQAVSRPPSQEPEPLWMKCELSMTTCSNEGPVAWADAIPESCGTNEGAAFAQWVTNLQHAGCTQPVGIHFPPPGNLGLGGGVLFSRCPVSVEVYSPEPGNDSWADTNYCDACIPLPPPGFINVVWGTRGCMNPGGCRNTTCAGIPIN